MKLDGIYVAGTGSWLPPRVDAAEAVSFGLYDPLLAERNDIAEVAVAGDVPPPHMAAEAARAALVHAGTQPTDIAMILHAHVYHQGNELSAPASYIQRVAVGNACPAIEVRQASNGGMAALFLAAAYLSLQTGQLAALVTAADAFPMPGIDRWSSDPGTVYGDGAGALVLSRAGGPLRLLSIALFADAQLEGMHRAGDPLGVAQVARRRPVDLNEYKRGYLARLGVEDTTARMAAGQHEALKTALDEADVALADITAFLLPHFGRRRLESNYLEPLGIELERTTWRWGRHVGHLGAADQLAGLDFLWRSGALRPGDRCLLMGVGSGFTWSAAVIEVLDPAVTAAESIGRYRAG
jgi:3-oxoacyl-[acyl-carrier-protein] synthase-3